MSTIRQGSPILGEINDMLPSHLSKMTIATPPQANFDKADQFLLEANELRAKAAALLYESRMIKERANRLQDTAFDLQRLATQDRKQIQEDFNKVSANYDHILSNFHVTSKHGKAFGELLLAVEDGTALAEDVCDMEAKLEVHAEKLKNQQRMVEDSRLEIEDEIVSIALDEVQQSHLTRKRSLSPDTSDDDKSQQACRCRKVIIKRAKHDHDNSNDNEDSRAAKSRGEAPRDVEVDTLRADIKLENKGMEDSESEGGKPVNNNKFFRFENENIIAVHHGDRHAILDKNRFASGLPSVYNPNKPVPVPENEIKYRGSSAEQQTVEEIMTDVKETQTLIDTPKQNPEKKGRARRVRKVAHEKYTRGKGKGDKIDMRQDDATSDLSL